jgi:hypothetical protein
MNDENRYRAEAEKAEQKAKRAATDHERETYLRIADGWRKLLAQKTASTRLG